MPCGINCAGKQFLPPPQGAAFALKDTILALTNTAFTSNNTAVALNDAIFALKRHSICVKQQFPAKRCNKSRANCVCNHKSRQILRLGSRILRLRRQIVRLLRQNTRLRSRILRHQRTNVRNLQTDFAHCAANHAPLCGHNTTKAPEYRDIG